MTIPSDPERIARGLFWTRAWSLIEGCSKVGPGGACLNCWSESASAMRCKQHGHAIQKRYGPVITDGRFNGKVRFQTQDLANPLSVRKPQTYAVWNDLFHEGVADEQIDAAFGVMRAAWRHEFLVLTKRIDRALRWFEWADKKYGVASIVSPRPGGVWVEPGADDTWPLPNVMIGTTAEDQQRADERIPVLLKIPGRHFVSLEPLLGPVDIASAAGCTYWDDPSAGILWSIAGAETGPGKRPMDLDWARQIRDQCVAANVPFFLKKLSDGNRELDGKIWDQLP